MVCSPVAHCQPPHTTVMLCCVMKSNIHLLSIFVVLYLQVQENLLQAAFLRLPVSHARTTHYQRQREVRAVVGEVTALMALNKVTHQVRVGLFPSLLLFVTVLGGSLLKLI